MQTIVSRGLTFFSLFKLLFCGFLIPLFILCLLAGIHSYFGYDSVQWQGHYVHGGQGFVMGMIFGIVFPAIISGILSLILWLGLWLWTRITTISLTVKE